MAVEIDDMCEAAASAINIGTGLRAKGYVDDITNPPEVQVYTRDFDPRMVFSGVKQTVPMAARVFVQRTNTRTAYKAIRAYMARDGASSILAALENEDNWTTPPDYAVVTGIGQPFEQAIATSDTTVAVYLAVEFEFDVCW